jgi:hypothetical protein
LTVEKSDSRLLLRWVIASIPGSALAGALELGVLELMRPSGGFFSLGDAPLLAAALGGVYGALLGLVLAVPRLLTLRLWAVLARSLGDIDVSRGRILIGMVVWSFPVAVFVGVLGEPLLFFFAWGCHCLGLFLPRAALHALRPGVFQE